jgi:uncharacterized membrane protein YdfJ with MMPL/SSD domain
VLFVLGAVAASHLGDLLSNRFSVPGSQAERGLDLLRDHMHDRSDGAFTLVATGVDTRADRAAVVSAAARAARTIPGAKAGPPLPAARGVVYLQLSTPLENAEASAATPSLRAAIGRVSGVRTYLSGFPAINHDTQEIFSSDLRKGETIAVPFALIVVVFMFGTLGGVVIPFAFALITIPTTLGFVWIAAHAMDMAIYVTNVVALIGLAIAIDYSMLVVFRYREELARGSDPHEALRTTMATAGRATLFSGGTVAVGLALLVLIPLPFIRSLGVGGLFVPLVSITASATLLPALLATMGTGVNRLRIVPARVLERRAAADASGAWHRLATSIMRRPVLWFVASAVPMLALAAPALGLQLTGGDNRGVPLTTEATRGLHVLETTLGPGTLAPHQIVVDTGRPGGAAATVAAQRRLVALLRRDPQVVPRTVIAPFMVSGAVARQANLVDDPGRVLQVRAAGRTDSGEPPAIALVHRIRTRYLPAARFPAGDTVLLTGAPAFGVDFVDRAFGIFPWLVLAVLVVSYLLLLRAFRSVVLPAKAVVMNLLSVSATYGVLVLVFQHGWGNVVGTETTPQIDGWVPVFLFAVLFGLSMDYEVFLLARIREEWDRRGDNDAAIAYGLEHTGRIITAAAIIMVATFIGFVAGSFVALQEFGLGLAAAIALDATVVRAILVPATMKLLGRWNWYLPERVRRALRVRAARV